jgi:hypothetical protein
VIPVLLLVGLLAGRWYAVPLAVIVWPLLLGLDGVTTDPLNLVGGAGLAAVNTAIGVAMHKGLVVATRRGIAAARSLRNRPRTG